MAGVGVTTRKGAPVNIAISLQEPERTAQKNALFGASMKPRSRKGAHNVTRICNLEAYGLAPEPGTSTRGGWRALSKALLPRALGDELKKKLNCTVYIEDMPGKNAVTSAYPAAGSTVSSRAQIAGEREDAATAGSRSLAAEFSVPRKRQPCERSGRPGIRAVFGTEAGDAVIFSS